MRAATVLVVLAVLVAAAAAVPRPDNSRLLKAAQRLEEEEVGGVKFLAKGSQNDCVVVLQGTKCCNIAGSSKVKAAASWKKKYENTCGAALSKSPACSGGKGCTSKGWPFQCPMTDPNSMVRAQHGEVAVLGGHVYCEGRNGVAFAMVVPLSWNLNAGEQYDCLDEDGMVYTSSDMERNGNVDFSKAGFTTFHQLVGMRLTLQQTYGFDW